MNRFARECLWLFPSLLIFLSACSSGKSDTFHLVIYPDKNNLIHHINAGRYESADEARSAAKKLLVEYPNGDYEIGKNKIKDLGDGVAIYEDTLR